MNRIFTIVMVALLLGAGCVSAPASDMPAAQLPESVPDVRQESAFGAPLARANERVTKKPFGLYVTPKSSPVSPERFSGYHVGVDFETFADEQEIDVSISVICDGPLVVKKTATGYGGLAAQRCMLDDAPVVVVYGHMKLSSIGAKTGEILKRGQTLGVLGKGYSAETDGERKHLHLGIHKGEAITILGYVQKKSDLESWLDARLLLPL